MYQSLREESVELFFMGFEERKAAEMLVVTKKMGEQEEGEKLAISWH